MRTFETEFLTITEFENTGKTGKFHISNKAGDIIGFIQWYGPFRKYCFLPAKETVWDNKCLKDVVKTLEQLMNERKIEKVWLKNKLRKFLEVDSLQLSFNDLHHHTGNRFEKLEARVKSSRKKTRNIKMN